MLRPQPAETDMPEPSEKPARPRLLFSWKHVGWPLFLEIAFWTIVAAGGLIFAWR